MKKQFGKLLSGLKNSQRMRKARLRKLRMESLEGRRLLAADLGVDPTPFHNPLIAEDVNYDFNISPLDALLVINELNAEGSRGLESGPVDPQGKSFIDVSGDGELSPLDALMIVNRLNGEGETDPLVTYTAEVTDLSGAPITQAVVGQSFRLNVFVTDTRPTGPTGVFQNAIDVGVQGHDLITFPTGGGTFVSNLTFGDTYKNGPRAFAGAAGNEAEDFFNEVTSFATATTPPDPAGGTYLFFSADIQADSEGTVNFLLNQHENEPTSQVNVFDATQTLPDNGRIDPSMIMYGTDSVTIITDPTAPVAMNDAVSTPEDTDLLLVGGTVDLTANDAVETGRTLSVVSIATIAGTTQGTVSSNTYTPPANFFGSDTLTYTVEDSTGLRSSATITIDVTPVNDMPTAVDDSTNVFEASTNNSITILLDNDSAGPLETADSLKIVATGTPDSGGTVTIAADGLSVVYTPNSTFLGTETFTYTIEDTGGLQDTATVTVDVDPEILPSARVDRITVAEDSTNNTISILANDLVNVGATKVLVGLGTAPSNGTATIDDGGTTDTSDDTILYTPNANFFGTDTFTYTLNDTAVGSADSVGTVSITVTDVNDPVALSDDTASTAEDTAATIAISSLLQNDSPGAGEDGKQTLSLTSVNQLDSNGTVVIDGTNVVFTPAADFNGTALFSYTAADNGSPSDSASATVTVTVSAVNDPPTATGDTASATEDTTAMIQASSLLANDSAGPANESTQTLTVTDVSSTSTQGGTVSLSGTTISYSPAADFNGADTFTYTLSDGEGGTDTGTVTVNVAAVNDAPIAGSDSVRAFKDNAAIIQVADLLANDSPGPANESGQMLSIASVSANNDTNGTVVLNTDGTITYTPSAGYTGSASFSYVLQDNGGGSTDTATGTVTISVEEFQPSVIAGTVWVDENNDGLIDNTGPRVERRLGGVEVTISGTSLGQTITPLTMLTLSDGSYSFENLGPGQYMVSYVSLPFMLDGQDVPGQLGDSDSVNNQFTIDIVQPGGANATDYNFGLLGIEPSKARILDQYASRYAAGRPVSAYSGAYFGLGSDNSLHWGAMLDGYSDIEFSEAVLSDDGKELLFTTVDSSRTIRTAKLGRGEFFTMKDDSGNALVRVLGDSSSLNWQVVSRGTPAIVSANKYLDAVDNVFDQEGWGT